MSDELVRIKGDLAALERAYQDAGGVLAADRDHCSCPFCHSKDGFWIGVSKHTGRPGWKCLSSKCPDRARQVSIVDLVMVARGCDSKTACKVVLEKYGSGVVSAAKSGHGGMARADGVNKDTGSKRPLPVPPGQILPPVEGDEEKEVKKKKGKLHMSADLAVDALLWSMRQEDGSAEFVKRWNYTNEKGGPVVSVCRFAVGGKKQVKPIHRDGNGWRTGLGDWGEAGKLMPMYGLPRLLKETT